MALGGVARGGVDAGTMLKGMPLKAGGKASREAVAEVRAAWSEAARSNPEAVNIDEFLGLDERGRFQDAAIEDAARRAHEAVRKGIDVAPARADLGASASRWSAAGAALLVLASLIAGLERGPGAAGGDQTIAAAAGSGGAAETAPREDAESEPKPDEPAPALPTADQDTRRDGEEAAESQDSPEITGDAKESAGKTGAGRSSGAMSSSAASESKSAPSSQGKSSDPSKPPKKKPSAAKKPEDSGAEPEPQERQEDEQSGSTAGKGSSKGSNKNPTASDWKSRDQVTETDDQEIEDDEETDDDEEEQENRGGVQPSLRDRRPPVSRDLQIGFGNRPNPDANGRGNGDIDSCSVRPNIFICICSSGAGKGFDIV